MPVRDAFVALLLALVCAPRTTIAADLSRVYDAALGGDMVVALSILDSLDTAQLSPEDSATAACIQETFRAAPLPENLPPRSEGILRAYRVYWQSVMLRRAKAPEAETLLLAELNSIMDPAPPDTARARGLEAVTEWARAAVENEGLHALAGVTSPFWEMMIWKTQTPTTYKVKLTDRAIGVRVVFLDDFVSLGWAGYATCGRAHTGGWATKEELYALKSSYDLSSENFRVSYLAHEGRHFSDYGRFPKLEQPELEYRAKLTEIALSEKTTQELITNFTRRNGRDRDVPHSFANYCVARDLGRAVFGASAAAGESAPDPSKWAAVPAEKLRQGAAKLLRENDATLKRRGAAGVSRFLEVDDSGK